MEQTPGYLKALRNLCVEFDQIQRFTIQKFFERAKTEEHKQACITLARKTGLADLAEKLEKSIKNSL